jgi:hypothetical protein
MISILAFRGWDGFWLIVCRHYADFFLSLYHTFARIARIVRKEIEKVVNSLDERLKIV